MRLAFLQFCIGLFQFACAHSDLPAQQDSHPGRGQE